MDLQTIKIVPNFWRATPAKCMRFECETSQNQAEFRNDTLHKFQKKFFLVKHYIEIRKKLVIL
eukprot:TRINITY_DN10193_c0_g1_i1.p2 TRINITY_DN10193_c0_g1~~TRINITY_DN10193_c0_g1_i1.p2  ORF type:complete len:63 (-),score=5.19 TRINITY_DN10193_c0_g1_i1:279-467(-)